MSVTPAAIRSYTLARCTLESYDAYNLRRNGMSLEDIGKRYGLSSDGARYRVRRIEKAFKDGTLNEKIRKAKEVVEAYSFRPEPVTVRIVEERLPVRCISGARFSPLY